MFPSSAYWSVRFIPGRGGVGADMHTKYRWIHLNYTILYYRRIHTQYSPGLAPGIVVSDYRYRRALKKRNIFVC